MPIRVEELSEHPSVARLPAIVEEQYQQGAYIRFRRHPPGQRPFAIGQVKDLGEGLIDRVVAAISDANSVDPILMEYMSPGGQQMWWHTTIPPLMKAYENAMQSRLDLARVNGDSQVLIAAFELIGRLTYTQMSQAEHFYDRWTHSENRQLDHKYDLMELQLAHEWGLGTETEDPELAKWRHLAAAFGDTFKMPATQLGNLFYSLAKRAQAQTPGDGPPAPTAPPPAPAPAPAPAATPAAAPAATAAPEPQPAPTDGQQRVTPEELADTAIGWIDELFEHAPQVLMEQSRLEPLRKHMAQLEALVEMMKQTTPADFTGPPEPPHLVQEPKPPKTPPKPKGGKRKK